LNHISFVLAVFVEGLVGDGGRWLFYYGGADKNVGVANAPAR
jgi:predicted GH43/DUF377 family glycosyl hydrolase